ncbi:MAG: 6-phosphogluconolactonase [Myxococcales bacterium]|nr:6-phosphogluconolactonase [Myxococcales bacterium]
MSGALVATTDDLASVAGPLIGAEIQQHIALSGRCRLALPGGSTPGSTLAWLAAHLPAEAYGRLWITWVDERHTPDAADRNDALARRSWLDHAPAAACVLPMGDGRGDLDEAVERYVADFQREFGGIDVAVLGAGPDGHIASLFPGHPALAAQGVAVAVPDSPKPPPARLSLTLPTLEDAACVVVLARGADKAAMLAEARGGALPLGRLAPAGAYHWILDHAAAARLGARP